MVYQTAEPCHEMPPDQTAVGLIAMQNEEALASGGPVHMRRDMTCAQARMSRDQPGIRVMVAAHVDEARTAARARLKMVDHSLILRGPIGKERVPEVKDITNQYICVGGMFLQEAQNEPGARRQRPKMQIGQKKCAPLRRVVSRRWWKFEGGVISG